MKSADSASRVFVRFVLLGVFAIAPLHAWGLELAKVVRFDIPAQALSTALIRFAQQTDIQVVTSGQKVEGVESKGVAGELAVSDALGRILAGTGFGYRVVGEGTITIVGNLAAGKGVEVAQVETGSQAQSGSSMDESAGNVTLEEVIVTGTHIRGTQNNTVPITVLDKAYIDSTGFSTTARLIESLPQNFALTTQSGVNVPGTSAARNQGSSINLRGVGEGTTLVLLNGRRIAPSQRSASVDVSALPLSAIERVEILTDGASALYGADAVGGVVNFILRKDFEGFETRLRSGWADGGINEYRVSQAMGKRWTSGNALVSLEYYKRDMLLPQERDFVPSTSDIGSLAPRDKNYSAMFSGEQRFSEAISLFADALYAKRDSFSLGGQRSFDQNASTDNPQIVATVGVDWHVGGDWQIETAGSYSKSKLSQALDRASDFPATASSTFDSRAAQIKADGSLLTLPGGKVRMAIGAEWRSESFDESLVDLSTGAVGGLIDSDQIIRSAFTEVQVPIVGESNARKGVRRLQLSVAGRFDDYSSSGSSFDPQVGLMWEPVEGLRLRGSHGTSYKAPNLVEYSLSNNAASAFVIDNSSGFLSPGAPAGIVDVLLVNGVDTSNFSPQQSENSSFGFELAPRLVPGLKFGFNYYRINYRDRIADTPDAVTILVDPTTFGGLLVQTPSLAQTEAFIATADSGFGLTTFDLDGNFPNPDFSPTQIDVVVDLRRRNLSALRTQGLDISLSYARQMLAGDVRLGLVVTRISELVQRITSRSAPFDTVDTIYNPPNFRGRGALDWQRQGWAANLFVNYVDSYQDTRTVVPTSISSYTTVDARVAYDFSQRFASGPLSGVSLAASAQNLFDREPPHTSVLNLSADMGFDPTNANPMGRLVAIELTKTWH